MARPSASAIGSSPHTRGALADKQFARPFLRIIPAYAGSTSQTFRGGRGAGDHPRIRGEHRELAIHRVEGLGSSPHTRGALTRTDLSARRWRIIPAYAGSTCHGGRARSSIRDHPRIRGEHHLAGRLRPGATGSSPHTRGALQTGADRSIGRRIIPAYAGSTTLSRRRRLLVRDHPRIRGEHIQDTPLTNVTPGSSPHTRGAPPSPSPPAGMGGIIPAYAGSTPTPNERNPPETGSSPHTRGAPAGRARSCRALRIIPAYAGSTGPGVFDPPRGRDHPRIRGEHISCSRFVPAIMGSSPHTRGAPALDVGGAQPDGIIPAYAGSTPAGRRPRRGRPDHPRIRGEHVKNGTFSTGMLGSSPHTRGARGEHLHPVDELRIIPAYAGSTKSLDMRRNSSQDHPRIRGEHGLCR